MLSVFLGSLFDEIREKELISKSKTGVQNAANQYQKGFISGLQENVIVYSALTVGTYPNRNTQLIFKSQTIDSKYGEIHYLPFINLHLLKDYCFKRSIMKFLKQHLKNESSIKLYVYSLYEPFLFVVKSLKKTYKNRIHVCLIVPDLPGKYGIMRKWYTLGGIRDLFEADRKMKLANLADSFVFLTDSMKELFASKPYTVIEGFLPDLKFDYSQKRISKTILYTGSLNPQYGILDLLDAFSRIEDPLYQLWICGTGGVENIIVESASRDSRIKFYGYLSKEEITKMQALCDVLVNPRAPDGEYTKYSFPSKTMEYLLSGSKVVMHRLGGIPNEYYNYIYCIDSSDNKDLMCKIIEACSDCSFYPYYSEKQVKWIQDNKQAITLCKEISSITNN